MSDDTTKIKKPRGNPNFQKGKKNTYYDKPSNGETNNPAAATDDKTMSDKTETQPPAGDPTTPPTSDAGDLPFNIFDDTPPGTEELPLDGEVEEQAYGNLNLNLNDTRAGNGGNNGNGGGGGSGSPPPPPGGSSTPPPPQGGGSGTPPAGDGTVPPPSSDPVTATPPPRTEEDIRNEASQMVKVMIRGYEKLHDLGRYYGKVSMEELTAEHDAGKININRELPFGKRSTTVGGFFTDYNASIDENIVVSDEFKKEITPPLERIAIRRGWTMGDEMFVALVVGEDLATKAGMLWGLKHAANMILESCRAIESGKAKRKADAEKKKAENGAAQDPQPQQEESQYAQYHDDMPQDGWVDDDPSR